MAFPGKPHYKSDHIILDDRTYENDLKDFCFTFIELPKFTKQIHELESLEEQWYYFLKHAEESNSVDEILGSNSEIREAYNVLERTVWTEWELQEYERVAMAVADAEGALIQAKRDGLTEGRAEGLAEGLAKGKREAQLAIAAELLSKQFSVKQVAEMTGLPLQVIQNDILNKS